MAAEKKPGQSPRTTEKSVDPSATPSPDKTVPPMPPDPTRYRDWEKGGRCIDF